jgi:succinoglycan biosynthesis transport protein ExoP
MDLLRFLQLLNRNRLTLILVPVLTAVAAYFLVKQLPDQYRSQARISTGLVDKTDQGFSFGGSEQASEINQKFENIIQNLYLKKTLDQVAYQLILHDLKAGEKGSFRKPSKQIESLSAQEKAQAIAIFTQKHRTVTELSPWNPAENKLIQLLESVKYDNTSLAKSFSIYRLSDSDYINLEFEGENPQLTAFAVNTLAEEFITNFSYRLKLSNDRSIEFLERFMNEKLAILNGRMDQLKMYKIENRVLNLNEQARALYGQLVDFEGRKETALKDVIAYTAALKNIDNKFDPADRRYLESSMTAINQRIVVTKQHLRAVNDAYYRSNFDPKYKGAIDSLQNRLTSEINESTDKYIYNPLVAKTDLVTQKMNLEISLELARNSIESIQKELNRLNLRLDKLVPNEARIQEYETSIDVASKEYIEALQRYNEAKMRVHSTMQLHVIEKAAPGVISPSKKMILVLLAGVVSFVFCLLIFFILFYLDRSIRTPQELADATQTQVLGHLVRLPLDTDQRSFWEHEASSTAAQSYRNWVRSIRFELERELGTKQIAALTSLVHGEGKTQTIVSLAHAFTRVGKRVLLIDGNFDAPAISRELKPDGYLEEVLQGSPLTPSAGLITVLGNRGGDTSLFELAGEPVVRRYLQALSAEYDILLIETPSLTALNKTKEWLALADRVVAVFEAGHSIKARRKPAVAYLKGLGDAFAGWVLTKVTT